VCIILFRFGGHQLDFLLPVRSDGWMALVELSKTSPTTFYVKLYRDESRGGPRSPDPHPPMEGRARQGMHLESSGRGCRSLHLVIFKIKRIRNRNHRTLGDGSPIYKSRIRPRYMQSKEKSEGGGGFPCACVTVSHALE
jgi:hypothetical protein